nr:hypothetical protein [Kibdelosporangium sp. MJ126-NF4]CTQ91151.1 hypothetical protein [Kibdelosporangium sp. MJ126-NF4]
MIEDSAATTMLWALIKTAVPQMVITLVPSLVAVAATFGMVIMAYVALGDLASGMWWLALVYLALLAAAIVIQIIRITRGLVRAIREARATDHPEVTQPPSLAELDTKGAWRIRAITAPAALLAAVHFAHVGWTPFLATVAALVGWLGVDIATLLTHSARMRLYRVVTLISPTPRSSPEI